MKSILITLCLLCTLAPLSAQLDLAAIARRYELDASSEYPYLYAPNSLPKLKFIREQTPYLNLYQDEQTGQIKATLIQVDTEATLWEGVCHVGPEATFTIQRADGKVFKCAYKEEDELFYITILNFFEENASLTFYTY